MSDVRDRYRRLLTRGEGTERIEFFSDAVFAIALTLLALEIRLPDGVESGEVAEALAELWPQLFAYFLTFAILALNWVSHHRKFRVIERYDAGLMWLNLAFLSVVALTPFPTSVLSEHGDTASVVLYAVTVAMLSLLQAAMWVYAWRRQLFSDAVDRPMFVYVLRNILVAPVVFLVSIPIALWWDPYAAMYFWITLAVLSPVVGRIPVRGDVSRSRG